MSHADGNPSSTRGTVSNGRDVFELKDLLFMWAFDARRLDHAADILVEHVTMCKKAAGIVDKLIQSNQGQQHSSLEMKTSLQELHELLHEMSSRRDYKDYFNNIFDKVGLSIVDTVKQ